VVGIHSPEFDREREVKSVQAAAGKNKLNYPHYIDNDFAYWRALQNQYWPAFYLIDKKGKIRAVEVGEMHRGTARAKKVEEQKAKSKKQKLEPWIQQHIESIQDCRLLFVFQKEET